MQGRLSFQFEFLQDVQHGLGGILQAGPGSLRDDSVPGLLVTRLGDAGRVEHGADPLHWRLLAGSEEEAGGEVGAVLVATFDVREFSEFELQFVVGVTAGFVQLLHKSHIMKRTR